MVSENIPCASYWNEMWWLVKRGAPITGYQVFYSLILPSTLAFCGYLGKEELDSAALAISIFEITVGIISGGVQYSLMPLIAQNLSGTKKNRAGVFLQRGILASIILSIISIIIVLNTGNMLIAIKQNPELSVHAELYLLILIPGFFGIIISRALVAFTDAVGRLLPTFIMHAVSFTINIVLHYIFIFHTNLGLVGSALSLSICYCSQAVFQAFLIWKLNIHEGLWCSWSGRAFIEWGKFFKAVIPSIRTQFLWVFGVQIGNFFAGSLGKTEIAAESVLFQIDYICFLIPQGIGSAVIARLGHHLGHNDPTEGKRTVISAMGFMSAMGFIVGILIFSLRYEVPKLFSLDTVTTNLYVSLVPFLSFYTAMQLMAYPCISTLRAFNFHVFAMASNFVSYYIISIPIGVSLTFAAGWGIKGLWVGFVAAAAAFLLSLMGSVICINWDKHAKAISHQIEQETEMENKTVTIKTNNNYKTEEKTPLLVPEEQIEPMSSKTNKPPSVIKAIKSKMPLFLALLGLFLIALTIRLAVPPIIPVKSVTNSTQNFTEIYRPTTVLMTSVLKLI